MLSCFSVGVANKLTLPNKNTGAQEHLNTFEKAQLCCSVLVLWLLISILFSTRTRVLKNTIGRTYLRPRVLAC